MNRYLTVLRDKHAEIFKIISVILSIAFIVYLFPKEGKFKYEIQNLKGKPWPHEDFVAPFDFAILKSPEELSAEEQTIIKNINPYFKRDKRIFEENLKKVQGVLSQRTGEAVRNRQYEIATEILSGLYKNGIIQVTEIIENKPPHFIINVIDSNVSEERQLVEFYTVQQAHYALQQKVRLYRNANPELLIDILEEAITQNVFYDAETTNKVRQQKLENLSLTRGMIQKGERIISKGDLIDDEKFQVLQSLKTEYEKQTGGDRNYFIITIGQIIIVGSCILVLFLFLALFRKDIIADNTKVFFILLIIILLIFAASITTRFSKIDLYVIPFCILPIIIRAFYDTRLALYTHLITILMIGFFAPNGFEFVFIQMIAGIIAIFSIVSMRKRSQLFVSSIVIFMAYSSSYLGMSFVQEGDLKDLDLNHFGLFALNSMLTLFAYPLIYVFEKIFGFISDVSLLELSDTNSTLLRELGMKAPGTFQHSLQVANLAEAAIYQIGGSALLVRTGALYHDIGKMDSPMYFIENQSTGINPHDELSFEESAKIIRNHVIKGIEKAKKHDVPDQVIDFIRTHHGTTLMQYFYRSYLKNFPDEIIDANLFRYPGPIPFSKETAVLMMADSVEAASRSLKKVDNETIEKLVDNIINEQITQNQFINSDITFKDITKIKKIFKKMLLNIYHIRIEYPH